MAVSNSLTDIEWASGDAAYVYDSFMTGNENVYTFTHQGGNKYYIQNKQTKQYLWRNEWSLMLDNSPHLFTVQANDDGSVLIYNDELGYPLYIEREWDYFEFSVDVNTFSTLWLYSNHGRVSSVKKALYDVLRPLRGRERRRGRPL